MALRTLPSSLSTGVSADVTGPGYLIEFGYTSPIRFSTVGPITWNSKIFSDSPVKVSGLSQSAQGATQVTLSFSDLDNTVAAVILGSRISNVPVTIWILDRLVFGSTDVLPLLFQGYGDTASGTDTTVTVTASEISARTVMCPRRNITKALGFSRIPAAGTVIVWNGERYELKGAAQ